MATSDTLIDEALYVYAREGATEAARYAGVTTRTIFRWGRKAGVQSGYQYHGTLRPHGTTARYRSSGCTCDDCRAANAVYHRSRRVRHEWRECTCPVCVYARLASTTGVTAVGYYSDPDLFPKSRNGAAIHHQFGTRVGVDVEPAEPDLWLLPTVAEARPDWHDQANCHAQQDLFFSDYGNGRTGAAQTRAKANIAKAKLLCAACPVRAECLDYALATHQKYGVWGGLTVKERRGLTAKGAA